MIARKGPAALRLRSSAARIAVAALALVASGAGARAQPDSIRILAPHWEAYTEPNGNGYAWDVARAVYEPEGVHVRTVNVPYERAVERVQHGEADAWLASYPDEREGVVYPRWHFDDDQVVALMPKSRASAWNGQQSLAGAEVAWVLGYRLGRYLDHPVDRAAGLTERDSAMTALADGRIDYVLAVAYEIENAWESLPAGIDRDDFAQKKLFTLKLKPGFADTERGRALRDIWDRRLPEIRDDGTLARLYARYHLEGWPFEAPRH